MKLHIPVNPETIENMPRRASAKDWKIVGMTLPERLDFQYSISNMQFETLCKGRIPEDMDDKWFIYFEEGYLHFHRSWTGYEVFRIHLQRRDLQDVYYVHTCYFESDSNKFKSCDENSNRRLLLVLIKDCLQTL
jgi:hypothetical protein